MSGFFSKLFGGKKKASSGSSAATLVEETIAGLIEKGEFKLSFDVTSEMKNEEEVINVEVHGEDESLLTEKEGIFLDAIQLFVKRVVQHQLPEVRVNVNFDCGGFREEANKSLVELAEKLKDRAIEQGRSVYLRALPPKDRKIVHQHLANDERVRSRSVGDGFYKKIKIYPVKSGGREDSKPTSSAP